MARNSFALALIALGIVSAGILLLYGLVAENGSPEPNPLFWLFVVLFLVLIGWDVLRHLRALRS